MKTLRAENKALKAKAKADGVIEEKLKANDANFILLAETTASIHAVINPLIDRAFVGTSLLKKAYTSVTGDKLKEEVRESYKGHSAAIMGIVKESQDKVNYALHTHPELTMVFQHNEESITLLRNFIYASNTSTITAPTTATKNQPKMKL